MWIAILIAKGVTVIAIAALLGGGGLALFSGYWNYVAYDELPDTKSIAREHYLEEAIRHLIAGVVILAVAGLFIFLLVRLSAN